MQLYAEKGTFKKWLADGGSLDVLKDVIEMMESKEIWPEGYDAVAYDQVSGKSWWYDGEWNELKPMSGGPDDHAGTGEEPASRANTSPQQDLKPRRYTGEVPS